VNKDDQIESPFQGPL